MDDRDVALMAQIESGHVDSVSMIQLIGILAQRRLGPDTIDGVEIVDIYPSNPRLKALITRTASLTRRAFELIKTSWWYAQDRWPDTTPLRIAEKILNLPPETIGFRRWVNQRLEHMDVADAIRHGRET